MDFGGVSNNSQNNPASLQGEDEKKSLDLASHPQGQRPAHNSQETSESSTSSTLQLPVQQLLSQPGGVSQHVDKAQAPGPVRRPGGSAQAISFGTLMPLLLPSLPPDKAQSLNALYTRLKKQEISKEDFLRTTRMLVGDDILVNTVKHMQIKQMQGQISRQQTVQAEMPHQVPFTQHSQQISQQQQQPQQQQQQAQQQQHAKPSLEQLQQQRQAALQAQQGGQQQMMAMPQLQSSLDPSMHYQANSRMQPIPILEHRLPVPASSNALSLQQVTHEVDKPQVVEASSAVPGISGTLKSTQPPNSSIAKNGMVTLPSAISIPDTVTAVGSVNQVKTTPKKTSTDLKRPADISPISQNRGKKQKVAGDVLEQSIDQLNDVTAVSGVNLREEEEQLLAGPKEESRSTQAMRRLVQEEEGRLFLEKGPLRVKVHAIAAKYGVSVVTEEAEQCLSMSVEERLRNMLYKLMKISGRRSDQEKEMHKLVITSDIQKQFLAIRKKAKEAQEKQALEAERLRKVNEEKEKSSQNDGTSKEDGTTSRTKDKKKGDESKQKANAASLAARSANDMLLKWQMMAEQGRQKREGESGATTANDATTITGGTATAGSRDIDKKHFEPRLTGRTASLDGSAANIQRSSKKFPGDKGRGLPHQTNFGNQSTKLLHTITVKDIVAYLETEPQMAKSSLTYRLHNKYNASSQLV